MLSKIFRSKKQKCHNHPDKNAIGICASCRRSFCEDCLIEISDYYCCVSETCKNTFEKAKHNAIASCAGDLAEHVLGFIDGGTEGIRESQEEDINGFKVAAIYNEIVFLSLHNLMDTISKNLPDEESDIFFGVLYEKIRDILTIDYSDNIDAKEFQAYFDGTFKERREEYYQFPNGGIHLTPPTPIYCGPKQFFVGDQKVAKSIDYRISL